MKIKSAFALVAFLLVLQAVTFAQPRRFGMNHERMAEKLGLSEEQKAKIGDLRAKHQKEMIDLRAETEKLHLEKREMVKKGSIDRKAFLDLEERLSKSQTKMKMARASHKMDVYALMTTDQKEKIAKMADKLLDGKGRRGERGFRQGAYRMGPCKGYCEPDGFCPPPRRR